MIKFDLIQCFAGSQTNQIYTKSSKDKSKNKNP